MCLVILMQRSKQEGLGAAFGGGFTESVWGAQTSNVLVKATVVLAATFFICSIALARLYSVRANATPQSSSLQEQLLRPIPNSPTNAAGQHVVPTSSTATPATATNVTPALSASGTNAMPATSTNAPAK